MDSLQTETAGVAMSLAKLKILPQILVPVENVRDVAAVAGATMAPGI